MKKRGYTSTELARRANVLTSFLYDIISGKSSNPSTVKLARVAEALGISLTYLVCGSEEYVNTAHQNTNENYVAIPRIIFNDKTKAAGNFYSITDDDKPYHFNSEWIRSHLNADSSRLRIFTIDGDSMEPTLSHDDIVLIETEKCAPSPPGIFVIFDGFGLVSKRLEFFGEPKNSHVRVISDNPIYSSYECSISDITIVGRVVWVSRKI